MLIYHAQWGFFLPSPAFAVQGAGKAVGAEDYCL
jgi:hypothetical protein